MAQAFSSFDTYLAPFVKADNLSYKEVKQAIQSFVYGVNTPSRWGCVTEDTELLTVKGFKKYSEVKKGDLIYTWKDGMLNISPVNEIIIKPYKGVMHAYKGRGYNQTVSPDHRVLVKKHNEDVYVTRHSGEIFEAGTPYYLPVSFRGSLIEKADLTNEEIMLAAMVYTDGSIDMRGDAVHKICIYKSPNRWGNEELANICNALGLEYSVNETNGAYGRINKYCFYGNSARKILALVESKCRISAKFLKMSAEQAVLFLNTWAAFDGDEFKLRCQFDNDEIAAQLQQIAILAGKASYICRTPKANYVKVHKVTNVAPTTREEVEYDGIIWCPNVDDGVAVYRKDGCVFISGNCQAPFSNITLDWVVPNDMKNLPAIVGGKEMDFTYGDCKKEMDMVNKAFIEIMIEGDANGRGFNFGACMQ